jgi:proteic killer suppression protein
MPLSCGLRLKSLDEHTRGRRQTEVGGARQETVSLQRLVIRRDVVTDCGNNGSRYYLRIVIRSFSDSKTAQVFNRIRVSKWGNDVQRQALRKLLLLEAAENVEDLRIPPGNKLERLKGNRKGQYSIRINDQWRICFKWSNGNATDVEIVDYHKG